MVGVQGPNRAIIGPRTGPKWSLKENRSIFLYDSFAKNVGNDDADMMKQIFYTTPIFGLVVGAQEPNRAKFILSLTGIFLVLIINKIRNHFSCLSDCVSDMHVYEHGKQLEFSFWCF